MRAHLERQHDEHRVEIVAHIARGAVLVVDARGTAFGSALKKPGASVQISRRRA